MERVGKGAIISIPVKKLNELQLQLGRGDSTSHVVGTMRGGRILSSLNFLVYH